MLSITPFFLGLFLLGLVALSAPVALYRRKNRIAGAADPQSHLYRMVRAQGNYTEYVPLFLVGLLTLELMGANHTLLWATSWLMALGRTLHAVGLYRNIIPLRASGMACTFVSLSMLGIAALIAVFG